MGSGAARTRWDRWALLLLVAVTLALAIAHYRHYLDVSRLPWNDLSHDRHAHYSLGLRLALGIRQADFRNLLFDFLNETRLRPPLHPLLVAVALLVGGPDHRLAVLPSLAAWVGTVVLAFLAARRAVPWGGNLAGLVAALLVLASPAHRAFATDVMHESVGAFLSLLVLYLYLIAKQEPSDRAYRHLGLALTALFLEKYNYWMLAVAGLVLAEISGRPEHWWFAFRKGISEVAWSPWLRAQLRSPLNYLLVLILGLTAWVLLSGGAEFQVWGAPVSVRRHHNLVHLAYVLLFLKVLLWWRRKGAAWREALGSPARQLVRWHAWPVAFWFLLPKRPSYFFFYVSPAKPEVPLPGLGWGLGYYWGSFAEEYHLGAWSAILVLGLIAAAVLTRQRLRPGGMAVLWFTLVDAALTLAHPHKLGRFLHSWIAAGWVTAGIGAANLLQRAGTWLGRRGRAWVAGAAVALLAIWHAPALWRSSPAGLPRHAAPRASVLDISDYYLPYLAASRRAAFFATLPIGSMAQWTFLEWYGDRERLQIFPARLGISPEDTRLRFEQWLRVTDVDTLIFLDIPPGSSSLYFRGLEDRAQFRELIGSQTVFQPLVTRHFPELGATAGVWTRRRESPAAGSGPGR